MSDEPPKSVADISIATPEEEEDFERREAEERNRMVSRAKLGLAGPTSPDQGHKDLDRRMWDARQPSAGSPSFHTHLESGHQKPGHSVRKG